MGSSLLDADDNFLSPREKKRKANQERHRMLQTKNNGLVPKAEIGTPSGNKIRMQEFKDKLLTAVNGNKIIEKTIQIAMDDDHPGQTTALKMCMDRFLPTSMFEEKKDGSRTAINITISGIGDTVIGETIENDN